MYHKHAIIELFLILKGCNTHYKSIFQGYEYVFLH